MTAGLGPRGLQPLFDLLHHVHFCFHTFLSFMVEGQGWHPVCFRGLLFKLLFIFLKRASRVQNSRQAPRHWGGELVTS